MAVRTRSNPRGSNHPWARGVPHIWEAGAVSGMTGVVGPPGVLAHQGGWDEALMLLAPFVLFVVLLRISLARACQATPTSRSDDTEPSSR